MRGRKPKSPAQHELSGHPHHGGSSKGGPAVAAPDAAFEAVPLELADNALAAAEWERLVPVLRQQRLIAASDRAALIAVCLEWSQYLRAMNTLAGDGAVLRGSRGRPRLHPQLSIAHKSLAACCRLWPELGCTPASRARVPASAGPPEDDPFSQFDIPPELKPHPSSKH